jgi:hypothetical protein
MAPATICFKSSLVSIPVVCLMRSPNDTASALMNCALRRTLAMILFGPKAPPGPPVQVPSFAQPVPPFGHSIRPLDRIGWWRIVLVRIGEDQVHDCARIIDERFGEHFWRIIIIIIIILVMTTIVLGFGLFRFLGTVTTIAFLLLVPQVVSSSLEDRPRRLPLSWSSSNLWSNMRSGLAPSHPCHELLDSVFNSRRPSLDKA